jgi:2-methylcitrate dehydratase PrpD
LLRPSERIPEFLKSCDTSVLLRGLGTAFRGEALSYKPYPCGRPLHAAIDAALAVRAELQIARANDIAAVTIEADPAGHSWFLRLGERSAGCRILRFGRE